MGADIALAVAHLTPVRYEAAGGDQGGVLTTIFIVIGVLVVLLLIGLGVTLARRPGRQLDEWGNPVSEAKPPPAGGPAAPPASPPDSGPDAEPPAPPPPPAGRT